MRVVLFSAVILLFACNQQPVAKPQPKIKGNAKTQAELFAYSWKGKNAVMYINKRAITFKDSKFKIKINWISDTSFTTYNYYEVSHEEPEIKKLDTVIFLGKEDWIMKRNISKQTFITESIEVPGKYHRHEKR